MRLLEQRDLRIFDELCWLCDMLTIEEATPVLMEMLRDKEFASRHGVELIKDVFRGTPAQWEAYLREALSEIVRALVEPGPGGISPPPVSEEAVERLREYKDSYCKDTCPPQG